MKTSRIYPMLLVLLFYSNLQNHCYAGQARALYDLDEALSRAREDNKMIFIQYGRSACGNCQNLKSLIQTNKVKLPEEEFIYVDLNCDDARAEAAFESRYKVKGSTLPFVVITDCEGKEVESRSGYGKQNEYNNLIRRGKIRARGSTDSTTSTGSDSNEQKSNDSKVKTIDDIRNAAGWESPTRRK